MREMTKKATFNISVSVLKELDEIMAQGVAPSKNTLVEQALIKELKELKNRLRGEKWKEAAKDPLLIKDVEDTGKSFYKADSESARRIG